MDDSVGSALRQAREQRRLTVEQAAERTKIRPRYLQALENDDLAAMPSAAQARGFLRLYADFLGLDSNEFMAPELPREAAANPSSLSVEMADHPGGSRRPKTARPVRIDTLLDWVSRRGGKNAGESVIADPPNSLDSSGAMLEESKRGPKPDTTQPAFADTAPEPPDSADASAASEAVLPSPAIDEGRLAATAEGDPQAVPPKRARAGLPAQISRLVEKLARVLERISPAGPDLEEASSVAVDAQPGNEPGGLCNADDFNPAAAAVEDYPKSADEVFVDIGAKLRQRRELLSLTHDEVERHIHVRAAFLKSLEQGALDALPSPVQTRGILANYAGFLDLDVDAIMLHFAEGLQARLREQRSHAPPRVRTPMTVNTSLPPLRSFIASDLLFGGGMAIVLVLFAVWGIGRVIAVRSSIAGRPTSPSISDVLVGTPLPALPNQVTLVPAQATPLISSSEPAASGVPPTLGAGVTVQIDLQATGRTYMRITVDGKVQFDGRSEPGQNYVYQAAKQIEVLVGDAAAVQLTYNGRDLGLMGGFGEVLDRIYTQEGVATPTATPAPTRTPTPNVSATPSLTPTRTPSVTPTPNP